MDCISLLNSSLKEIVEEISEPDGKYFGGVTAYLCGEIALALLEKLDIRVSRKNDENTPFFLEATKHIQKLKEHTISLAEEDGVIFKKMFALEGEERNVFLKEVILEQEKFLGELEEVISEAEKSLTLVKGSVKEDYVMVEQILKAVYSNISSIIIFERKKIK